MTVVDYTVVDTEPAADDVRRLTFVPFLNNGTCIAIPDGDRLRLPTGEVLPGEHYLLDSCLRIPLLTAGYRMQQVRPFAVDTDEAGLLQVYA